MRQQNWVDIYLKDTVSEEILAGHVIRSIRKILKDGIRISEVCRILTDVYGIANNYCCDMISLIKLELGLYSPDMKHLYYA